MRPELTPQAILSHLAASDDPNRLPPYYAQRRDDATTSTDFEAAEWSHNIESELFFTACPLYDSGIGTSSPQSFAPCSPSVFSLHQIQQEFIHVLRIHSIYTYGGRMSTADIGLWLGMDEPRVSFVGDSLCGKRRNEHAEGMNNLVRVHDMITHGHSYALRSSVMNHLVQTIHRLCNGTSSDEFYPSLDTMAYQNPNISVGAVTSKQLSHEMGLTLEDVTMLLNDLLGDAERNKRADLESFIVLLDEKTGMPTGVTNAFVSDLKSQPYLEQLVLNALYGVTTPVSLESLFAECSNDPHQLLTVQSIANKLCDAGKIYGTVQNATFTPAIYSSLQRKCVDSFFRANGFLSEKRCIGLGLSKNRMECFVKESFLNATSLKKSIIDSEQLCLPLEDAIRSSVLNKSFADLKSMLPEELVWFEEDLVMISKIVFDNSLRNQDKKLHDEYGRGLSVIQGEIALFFSASMIEQAKKLMPPLIEDFSKQKANEIMKQQGSKIKVSTSKGHNYQSNDNVDSFSVIPLVDVAKCIAEAFPDLSDIQKHHEMVHNRTSLLECGKLMWSASNHAESDGPLIEFCRHALDYGTLHDMCMRAINAEIIANKNKVNATSRVEGAAKIQSTEEAFETSFRELCYLLQIFAKTIHAIEGRLRLGDSVASISESEMIHEMKNELLFTCGSCIAKRITEYCLFKQAISDEQSKDLIFDCLETGLPHREHGFCFPVDLGSLTFPVISLATKADKSGKRREPLLYLKSLFSPNIGLHLVQMWNLCTNNNAKCDNSQHKLEAFLHHLDQTCLPLVGIPFSVLDKKNEKRILASRRQCILDQLEYSNDKEQVLLSAIVLVFQLAKNTSLAGKSAINYLLDRVFVSEKKIPQPVIATLHKLKQSEDHEREALMAEAKTFGLVKNFKTLSSIVNTT
eukprot:CCRYP_013134-RB/>CCRYP_013134-RB protein AED:0.18 eAED:0.18 QI:2038/1/1/1/0.4/0.16/6/178/911